MRRIALLLLAGMLGLTGCYGYGAPNPSPYVQKPVRAVNNAGKNTRNTLNNTGRAIRQGTNRAVGNPATGWRNGTNAIRNTTQAGINLVGQGTRKGAKNLTGATNRATQTPGG